MSLASRIAADIASARMLLERSREEQRQVRRSGDRILDPGDSARGREPVVTPGSMSIVRTYVPLPGHASARAAASLARSCLEAYVEQATDLDLGDSNMRSRLIVWEVIEAGTDRPREAARLWAALSGACHQHAFEYPPNVPEVDALIDRVEALCVLDSDPALVRSQA
ncbi:MAG: hypothetical protein ACKN9D_07780 [Actinomycetales bacterium]